MKTKVLMVMFISFLSLGYISCEKESIVGEDQLPVAAKEFLSTHFSEVKIVRIEKEKDARGTEYSVKLADGMEADFDKSGNWIEVDAVDGMAIPTGFILPGIIEYVNESYPNTTINGIEKKKSSYEVELNNDLELVFDLNGQFLRVDK